MMSGRAHISLRVGTPLWMDEDQFGLFLDKLTSYPDIADSVMLFTSMTHGPILLDEIKRRMDIAGDRLTGLRESGFQAGINVLATIGHHEESLSSTIGAEYGFAVDIDGKQCRGSFCPGSKALHQYVRELYKAVCTAEPDFIWVDDDVRLLGHLPVRAVCFCDNCLDVFSDEYGTAFDRKSLSTAFDSGTVEGKLRVRSAWLQHNRNTVAAVLGVVEQTVHDRVSTMPLGFMTGERFYEGYDFTHWASVLSGKESMDVFWRPGGGFYSDRTPGELMHKSHEIGRQVSALPTWIENIQSEIENFPYQLLRKSAHITVTEAASHIAAGCTGTAFNVLPGSSLEIDEFHPILDSIRTTRPFLDLLTKTFGRTPLKGACAGWNRDVMATGNLRSGRWVDAGYQDFATSYPAEIFEIGIPAAYAMAEADIIMLKGDVVLAFSRSELEGMLARAVYIDGCCLAHLCQMGLSELVGFEPGGAFEKDCIEVFAKHELNGSHAGKQRDVRQSFWPETVFELRPTGPDSQKLSSVINYENLALATVTHGIFENRLGGRVSVSGYAPWSFLQSKAKSDQIKSVFRWLCRDRLDAYISSYHKINIWIRHTANGIAVVMLNSSFDVAIDIQLKLLALGTTAILTHGNLEELEIPSSGSDGNYAVYKIPLLAPWQICLLRII